MKPASIAAQAQGDAIWSITSQVGSKLAERHIVILPSSGLYDLAIKKKESVHTPTRTAQVDIRLMTAGGTVAFERTWKSVGGLGSPKETKVHVNLDLSVESAPATFEITVATTVLLGKLRYRGMLTRRDKPANLPSSPDLNKHRRTHSSGARQLRPLLSALFMLLRSSPTQSNPAVISHSPTHAGTPHSSPPGSASTSPRDQSPRPSVTEGAALRASGNDVIGGARLARSLLGADADAIPRRSSLLAQGVPKRLSSTPPPNIVAQVQHSISPTRGDGGLAILLPQLLTHITGSVVSTSMRNFLITFPRFTTTTQVLLEINRRAEATEPPPDVDPTSWRDAELSARMRLVNLVRTWVGDYWATLYNDSTAHLQIEHLIGILEQVGMGRIAAQLSATLQKRLRDGADRPLPPRPTSKTRDAPISSVLMIDPTDLAQQRAIPPADYLKKSTPLVIAYRDRFEANVRWVMAEIASGRDRRARLAVLKHLLKVATAARTHADFYTTLSVVQGLTHPTLARHDIEELPSKEAKALEALKNSLDLKGLRSVVRSNTPPALSPLSLVQLELAQLSDTQADADPPYINFVKYDALGQVIGELVVDPSQSSFPFELDQEIRDYILSYSAPPLLESAMPKSRSHSRNNSVELKPPQPDDGSPGSQRSSSSGGRSSGRNAVTDVKRKEKRESLTDVLKFLRGSSMIGESRVDKEKDKGINKTKKRAVMEVEPTIELCIQWLEKHVLETFLPYTKDEKSKEIALRVRAALAKGEQVALPPAPDGMGVIAVLLELRASEESFIPGPMLDCLVNASTITDQAAQRAAISTVVYHFPPRNFTTLRRIAFFLRGQQAIAGLESPFRHVFADCTLPLQNRTDKDKSAALDFVSFLTKEADFVFADRQPDAPVPGIERLPEDRRAALQLQLRQACLFLGLQVSHAFLSGSPPPARPDKQRTESVSKTAAPMKPESRIQRAAPTTESRASATLTGGYFGSQRVNNSAPNATPAAAALPASTSGSAIDTMQAYAKMSRPASSDALRSSAENFPDEATAALPLGRMLFSHTAEGEGEITVAAGALVSLLDFSRDDWWNIQVGDKEGWVPRTYVVLEDPTEAGSVSAALMAITSSASGGSVSEDRPAFAEGEDAAQVDLLAQMIESGRFTDVEAYLMMVDKRQSRQLSSMLACVLQQRIRSGSVSSDTP